MPITYAANILDKNKYWLDSDNLKLLFRNTELNIQNENIKTKDKRLTISKGQIILSPKLQQKLELEIAKAEKSLNNLSNFLGKQIEGKIGLVYIHQGYENWSIQFTYGGYLLDIEPKIIVKTSEVFTLKKIFANTPYLQIASGNYQTTRYMNQLGAILHES